MTLDYSSLNEHQQRAVRIAYEEKHVKRGVSNVGRDTHWKTGDTLDGMGWLVKFGNIYRLTVRGRQAYEAATAAPTPAIDTSETTTGAVSIPVAKLDAMGNVAEIVESAPPAPAEATDEPVIEINGTLMGEQQATTYVTEFALRASYGAIVSEVERERDDARAEVERLRAALEKVVTLAKHIDARVMSLVEIASEPDAWTAYRITGEDKLVVIDRVDNQVTHFLNEIEKAAALVRGEG